jgi:hypothetical protein
MSFASEFIARVIGEPQWGADDFRVVDVGASGGIADRWNAFGDRLWAVGFDPLVAEMHRVAALEQRPKVHYEAAFVGWPHFDRVFPPDERLDLIRTRHVQPSARVSAASALRLMKQDYVRENFNAGAPIEYTDRHITLDDYFRGQMPPDFLKIDTDGGDFLVLLGAERMLADSVLGVQLEAIFHGAVHDYANTFNNVDRFLRERGFSLFQLTPYRYSRADLPAPFVYDLPAQTTMGQVSWADALYLRDLAHSSYDETFGYRTTFQRVLKMCCLHTLYDLNDCAAELLLHHPVLSDLEDRRALLDALTPRLFGQLSYAEYISRFEADPTGFYPSRLQAGDPLPDVGERRWRAVLKDVLTGKWPRTSSRSRVL